MTQLIGQENFSDYGAHSQVYLATHDGEGNRLPYVNKAFISFSYGGKFIEDFGLLATIDNRLTKNLYADFEDTTTNYDTMDGQYYWGSHYTVNQLEFTLSTDGITQNQLEKFRQYFKPGVERELILAEHPNRAIMARVVSTPSISMIPFEKIEEISMNNVKYLVSTALYRGDITLAFTSDEPHWYGKLFYMPKYLNLEEMRVIDNSDIENNDGTLKTGVELHFPERVETLKSKDCLKMCLEDYLPYSEYLPARTFFGNHNYIKSEEDAGPRAGTAIAGKAILGITLESETGATIGDNSSSSWYIFYSGTAPSKPIIKFTIQMNYDSNNYIIYPKSGNKIATLQLGEKIFKYGLPSLFAGYNQAVKILNEGLNKTSLISVQEYLRDQIKESRTRTNAITIIKNLIQSGNELVTNNVYNSFITQMKSMFLNNIPTVTYEIHSDTGEAYGYFLLNTNASYENVKQNVGDMIRSEYLIIDERSNFIPGKNITADDCLEIISSETITDFLILFKNMYL